MTPIKITLTLSTVDVDQKSLKKTFNQVRKLKAFADLDQTLRLEPYGDSFNLVYETEDYFSHELVGHYADLLSQLAYTMETRYEEPQGPEDTH